MSGEQPICAERHEHCHIWQFTGRMGHIGDVWIISTEWACECGVTRWTEDGKAPTEDEGDIWLSARHL